MPDLGFVRKRLLTNAEALLLFEKYFDDIQECVKYGWQQWVVFGSLSPSLRLPLDARCRADFVWCHIVDEAKRRFTKSPGTRVLEEKGLLFFLFEDRAALRFKKLNQKTKPSNVKTAQQIQVLWQQPLEMEDMPPEATNVDVGYRLDQSGTEIKDIKMACWRGPHNIWSFDIGEWLGDLKPTIMPAPIKPATPKRPRVTAKGRPKRKKGTGSDG